MRDMTRAIIPEEANNVQVGQIDGWEPLVGAYRSAGSFEGGGWTLRHLRDIMTARAVEQGWDVDAAIEHPGATEIPMRRWPVHGTIHIHKPPLDFGGRVALTYDDGVVARPWIGAGVGAFVGLATWIGLSGRARARKASEFTRGVH